MDPQKPIRLLCSADLHLGRYPSRVPTGRRELSVEFVWEQLIDYAVEEGIDALLLAGDLVDKDNKFYESFGPLERGLKRLGAAGIPTFAVAGNHDHDVLPRLADVLDPDVFHLVGRGGRWEESVLTRSGAPVMGVLGWSFPEQSVRSSPLHGAPAPRSDIPVIGLIHGDLNADRSSYAPLSEADLKQVPVASWVLGHIHRPICLDHRSGCIVYPGSPQPLDPGEPGDHGPYLLEVGADAVVHARQVALATIKYAECEVDLTGVETQDDFESTLVEVLRERLRVDLQYAATLRQAVYRPRYVGYTSIEKKIDELHERARVHLKVPVDEAFAILDDHVVATRPNANLDELASGKGPLSELARLIVALEDEGPVDGLDPLLRDAERSLGDISRASAYVPLKVHGYADDPGEEAVRSLLARQGRLLLDEMIDQLGGGVS